MENSQQKLELLLKIFENHQTLISHADSKSNISLSLQTFITTSVLGASIIVDTFNKINTLHCFIVITYYVLFSLFLISSIISITFCILVFKPRPPQEAKEVKRKGITYFGHISRFKTSNEYLNEIKNSNQEDHINEFAFQNYTLAIILNYKMKFVKYATTLLFINILLGITLLIFSLLTK